ncbi:alcohol dehydrogenase catalytic domain-containing protein [Microbacterium sp. zg.Y625]|uniref:alcohol dehydrogenase catalytic domain-containing protein n=1 Tax=Microbacterium jiangjiandongii TaxID=3049071 RepID=UPI00214B5D10|nr:MULTISPECIES: alcohol dehydrogenase catalytic domain-containing protein [unclassified Microbacterium]MCR2793521.1 alcohol dehydrogenase catalytic domain-containing protein [Microbacterium sp. zg.Y625]WIM25875.1 alcohol dehydrogenase catalytic domain-containing protein [Microbacterium sp. zg-Y625]
MKETDMLANEVDVPGPLAEHPMQWREAPTPQPAAGQLLIDVAGCGVCRSNLHLIEGDWVDGGVPAISPIIPGHEVTGRVAALGEGVSGFSVGDPVGVQPLWWTCEECEFCLSDRENLCHRRLITGEHVNGGFAEFMLSNAAHTYHVPEQLDLAAAAPLFCPGITGYGAVKKLDLRPGMRVGVFGLGGVGHLALQFAVLTGAQVIAVARRAEHRDVALELGAAEAIDASRVDPGAALEDSLDAALTFAPSDEVTAQALRALKWGGTLVSGVPVSVQDFPFNREQVIKASILGSRRDMNEVLRLAAEGKIRTVVDLFPMSQAERALELLAAGQLRSRAVLQNAHD